MSVTSDHSFGDGLYVPFRGFDRSVGPAGTFNQEMVDAGDATGGTVTINLQMSREEFGFNAIFVPTKVISQSGLTTGGVVSFSFRSENNERLASAMTVAQTEFDAGSLNHADWEQLSMVIEPNNSARDDVMRMVWATNTNLVDYRMKVFGVVYDAQAIARGKHPGAAVDDLMAGIR